MPSLDDTLVKQTDLISKSVRNAALQRSPWNSRVIDEKTRWEEIKEMEKAVERLFVGAFSIEGNELNIRATLWNDAREWQYHLHITYTLNGKDREVRKNFDIHCVEHPRDIVLAAREAVIADLGNLITQEFVEKNQKVLVNAAREEY